MKTVWSFKSETAKIPVVSSNYRNAHDFYVSGLLNEVCALENKLMR
jgi:hypothetical protein